MDVTPLIPQGRQIIQSYGASGFRINGVTYDRPVLVTPSSVMPWHVAGYETLSPEDFSPLAGHDDKPDVILLGAGAKGGFFPPALRSALREQGFSVDVMDSGAACRTYNVLMAEGRRVAAALFPV